MFKRHRDFICLHATTYHTSFFSIFDHRTLIVVWSLYTLLLISIDKFDVRRVVLFTAFPLFSAVAARVSLRKLLLRVLALSPFIIIMAAANPFLDREIHLTLLERFPVSGGMLSAAVIFFKAMLSLTAMLVLDHCISVSGLCDALQRMHVPAAFTTQLMLMHRYIHLIISEAATLMKARDMRSTSKTGRGPLATANLIGTLLVRSTERSERVYRSMLARGFDGTVPLQHHQRLRSADALFFITVSTTLAVLRFIL